MGRVSPFKRFEEIHRLSSLSHAILSVIRHFIRPVLHFEKLLILERRLTEKPDIEGNREITFLDIDKHHIEDIAKYKHGCVDTKSLEKNILWGKTVTLVLDRKSENQILAYGYVDYQYISIMGLKIRLDSKLMYHDYAFTKPSARGRGIYPALLRHICSKGYTLGYERCLSCVLHYNKSSIRGASKAHFRKIGTIRSYVLFNKWKILLCDDSLLRYLQGT